MAPATEDNSLRGKLRRARHEWRSRKADRAYTRSYDDVAPAEAAGPRAAVYRGQMGRTHQRAARMQDAARSGARFQMPAFIGRIFDALSIERLPVRPGFVYSALVLACVAFVAFSVFPAAQDYYLQSRVNDQLAAEYEAVLARNEELEQHVATLQTDEGIEQLAHENLGWVKDGDHSVSIVVDGSADPGSDSLSATGAVAEGSVPTPETWYSPVLDVVFGYEG
jgi:cell division protein FtsB